MSRKPETMRADPPPLDAKTCGQVGRSNNVSSVPLSDSDSESESAGRPSAETVARFWAKVQRDGPLPVAHHALGRCWLWTANRVRGYGQFVLPREGYGTQRHVYAHRFSYRLAYGPLASADVKVCHHCDTPACVRPSHLFAGSQRDNLADARAKGRLPRVRHRHLSDADVRAIRQRYVRGNGAALGREFGTSKVNISLIARGLRKGAVSAGADERPNGRDERAAFSSERA